MKNFPILLLAALLACGATSAQRIFADYKPLTGSLQYGPAANESFPYGEQGFTLILPEKEQPLRGTILMLDDMRIDLKDTTRSQYVHIEKRQGQRVWPFSTSPPASRLTSIFRSPASNSWTKPCSRSPPNIGLPTNLSSCLGPWFRDIAP